MFGNTILNATGTGIKVGANYWVHDNVVLNTGVNGIEVTSTTPPSMTEITFNSIINSATTGLRISGTGATGLFIRNNAVISAVGTGVISDTMTPAVFGPNAFIEATVGTAIPLKFPLPGGVPAILTHADRLGYPPAGSGLLDAGEANTTPGWSGKDVACNTRPTAAATDIGAYFRAGPITGVIGGDAIRAQDTANCVGTPPLPPLPPVSTTNSPTAAGVAASFTVDCTAPNCAGNLDYSVNGQPDPVIKLVRGLRYEFNLMNTLSHPFSIHTVPTDINLLTRFQTGVTPVVATSGALIFDVPTTAPDVLYYQCEAHPAMSGPINIVNNAADAGTVTQPIPNPPTSTGGACIRDGTSLDVGVRFTMALNIASTALDCDLYLNNLANTLNFARTRIKLEDDK